MSYVNCVEQGCGIEFEITDGEKEFYEIKGMKLPKRCQKCRLKRKALKASIVPIDKRY